MAYPFQFVFVLNLNLFTVRCETNITDRKALDLFMQFTLKFIFIIV